MELNKYYIEPIRLTTGKMWFIQFKYCVAYFQRHFNQLKEEFAKMKPPESIPGSEDDPVPEECQNGCRDNSAGTSAQATTNGHPVNTNDKKTQRFEEYVYVYMWFSSGKVDVGCLNMFMFHFTCDLVVVRLM